MLKNETEIFTEIRHFYPVPMFLLLFYSQHPLVVEEPEWNGKSCEMLLKL